jgi:hypothetical protein
VFLADTGRGYLRSLPAGAARAYAGLLASVGSGSVAPYGAASRTAFRAIRQRSLRLDHLNPQTQEFSFPAGQRLDAEEAPDDCPEAQQARKQRRKKPRL